MYSYVAAEPEDIGSWWVGAAILLGGIILFMTLVPQLP